MIHESSSLASHPNLASRSSSSRWPLSKLVMTKTGLADAIATAHDLKKSEVGKILDTLASVATKEVKSAGKFTIPGLCMIKTRVKPATKAGKREMFGKTVVVKAKPAKTVVKAFCTAALKKSI